MPPEPPTMTARVIRTARTATCVHEIPGRETAAPVVLIHGNVSSSVFFVPLMTNLPGRFRAIAVDLRGFGGSDPEPVDATRGMRDFADDVFAVLDTLGIERAHLIGWSLGGGVAMRMVIDAPDRVLSMTLIAPISPFGFGGTIDAAGTLMAPDGAGSGAGTVSRKFVQALADGDGSTENRAGPRTLLRRMYVARGWSGADGCSGAEATPESDPATLEFGPAAAELSAAGGVGGPPRMSGANQPAETTEDMLVASMLTTAVGTGNYPGDVAESANWPGVAPGAAGVMNAMSPTYMDTSGIASIAEKPPILWVRGEKDIVISDSSAMDIVQRGRSGAIEGYPGERAAPPQPMLAQIRAVLMDYAMRGGQVRDDVVPGTGHAPHIEDVPRVLETLVPHLDGATKP